MQLKLLLAASLALLLLAYGCAGQPQLGPYGSAHEHADFKVYLDGAAVDFSSPQYQSPLPLSGSDDDRLVGAPTSGPLAPQRESDDCGNESRLAHLHGGDGDVVHKHATGVTWGYFFSTLGVNLSDGCLTLANGASHCDSQQARWRFFLNGNEIGSLQNTEIRNLDRALFTFGATDAKARQQFASVTYKAATESSEGGSCEPVG